MPVEIGFKRRVAMAVLSLTAGAVTLGAAKESGANEARATCEAENDPWKKQESYLEVHADRALADADPPLFESEQIQRALAQGAPETVDRFRLRLPEDQQGQYDQELQELKADPRLCFHYHPGATAEQGYSDLALRGFLAASWGLDDLRDQALDRAAEEHGGHLDVTFTPAPDLDFNPDNPYRTLGLTNQNGDMLLSQPAILSSMARGANVATHEFVHTMQADGTGFCTLPVGSDQEFQTRLEALFVDAYEPKKPDDKVHYLTKVGEDFRYFPQSLREKSPELYEMMVEYTGYDPLAGNWLVAS